VVGGAPDVSGHLDTTSKPRMLQKNQKNRKIEKNDLLASERRPWGM
jgi:hypothetical protein